MANLRLNLGCGAKRRDGFVNVDKFGTPDVKHDLETFPWPWDDNSVCEILLVHVLEHLGQDSDTYLKVMQEMYRICAPDASIHILVPHFGHDFFWDDPTHVRAVTPLGIQLFSKRLNKEWIARNVSNSPLGLFLDVDFELIETQFTPSAHWFRLHPEETVDMDLLIAESAIYRNLIEQIYMKVRVVK